MGHALTIAGQRALIFWGYREVGALSGWSLTAHDGGVGTLTGTIERGDAFHLSQQGLEVRIVRQKGQPWRWPVHALQFAGKTVTATVRLADEAETHGTQSLREA
jgi:hypothetical protein